MDKIVTFHYTNSQSSRLRVSTETANDIKRNLASSTAPFLAFSDWDNNSHLMRMADITRIKITEV